jgi:hypothetical protein
MDFGQRTHSAAGGAGFVHSRKNEPSCSVRHGTKAYRALGRFGYWTRMEDKLTAHKFKVGESVDYIFAGRHGAVGVYEVTQLMPVKDDQLQYRIKSASEPYERMVKESEPM